MPTDPQFPSMDESGTGSERFNFSRAGHLGADHQRTLRSLDEQLARNLTYALGAWLRTDVAVNSQANEQTTFFVFAERAAGGGYAIPIRMEPLHVRGAISLDRNLLPPMVDLLLGGSGRPAQEPRELTEIEETVLGSVLQILVRELNSAWRSLGIEFSLEPRESEGQEQRLMLATEKVLMLHFEVLMPELQGGLSICLSAASLNTILRQRSNRHGRARTRTPEERIAMAARLAGANVCASLQFPPVRLSTRELAEMRPGHVLRLGLPAHTDGRLRIAGVDILTAQPVCLGERRGARTTDTARSMDAMQAGARQGVE